MDIDKLNELRVFNLASNAIMPLLVEQHMRAYERLLARYRAGETNLIASIAECSANQALIEDIEAKLSLYENINQGNK